MQFKGNLYIRSENKHWQIYLASITLQEKLWNYEPKYYHMSLFWLEGVKPWKVHLLRRSTLYQKEEQLRDHRFHLSLWVCNSVPQWSPLHTRALTCAAGSPNCLRWWPVKRFSQKKLLNFTASSSTTLIEYIISFQQHTKTSYQVYVSPWKFKLSIIWFRFENNLIMW